MRILTMQHDYTIVASDSPPAVLKIVASDSPPAVLQRVDGDSPPAVLKNQAASFVKEPSQPAVLKSQATSRVKEPLHQCINTLNDVRVMCLTLSVEIKR